MKIRKLDYEDLKCYKNIILEFLIDSYMNSFNIKMEKCKKICNEKFNQLKEYNNMGHAIVIGAFKEDILIGFLWLYIYDFFSEPRLHINHIVVSNKFRGEGIGKLLMKEVEKQAEQLEIKTIDLFVSESNVGAYNMYSKMGYKTERRHLKKCLGGNENVINNYRRSD